MFFFTLHSVYVVKHKRVVWLDNIDRMVLVRRAAVLPLVPVNEVEDMWFHALENNDNDTPEGKVQTTGFPPSTVKH